MNEITMIAFKTDGPEADKQFIEEYVLGLVDRTSEMDEWERVGYARSGQGPIDGGQVSVFFDGDPETVISAEADRWDELISAGFADEWTHEEDRNLDAMEAVLGEQGAQLHIRQIDLAGRLSQHTLEEFESRPDPVDEFPEEDVPTPIGWWGVLHNLTVQMGYPLTDEIAAYTQGIRHTLKNIAQYSGPEQAEDELDQVIDELEGMREEIREGRDDM